MAALKLAYCTLLPEWMETMPKVFSPAFSAWAVGRAETVAAAEAARKRFLSCILMEWCF